MDHRQETEEVTVRVPADALDQLKEAAVVQKQDLAAFIVDCALDRARTVLADVEWSG